MMIVDVTETEIHQRIEKFLNQIDVVISEQNHFYKYKDDLETCQILNYLFKLSGSVLRINYDGIGLCLYAELPDFFESHIHAYMHYLQFMNGVLRLDNIVKAFSTVYRHKKRYQHLWDV